MPRVITEDALAQLQAGKARPCFFVVIQFSAETIYVWTGLGDMPMGGHTFKGVGTLGAISPITETMDTTAQGITLSLSGIPTDLLSDALTQVSTKGQAQVFLGFMTSAGTLVADPILSFQGFTDAPTIDMSTETTTISIDVESKLSGLQRARGGRYTDSCQRAIHPADGFFKYVSWLQDLNVRWKQ